MNPFCNGVWRGSNRWMEIRGASAGQRPQGRDRDATLAVLLRLAGRVPRRRGWPVVSDLRVAVGVDHDDDETPGPRPGGGQSNGGSSRRLDLDATAPFINRVVSIIGGDDFAETADQVAVRTKWPSGQFGQSLACPKDPSDCHPNVFSHAPSLTPFRLVGLALPLFARSCDASKYSSERGGLALEPLAISTPSGASGMIGTMLFDLTEFQRWATGNLVENRNRGIFGEWLVGQALGVIGDGEFRQEWDAVDLHFNGLSIEVKTSGLSQTWNQSGRSSPRFGIARQKRAWFADADDWITYDEPKRSADVYVFCLHRPVPATNENVADTDSWSFWVVATSTLDNEFGDQSSVGASTLDQLTEQVDWSGIQTAVKQMAN